MPGANGVRGPAWEPWSVPMSVLSELKDCAPSSGQAPSCCDGAERRQGAELWSHPTYGPRITMQPWQGIRGCSVIPRKVSRWQTPPRQAACSIIQVGAGGASRSSGGDGGLLPHPVVRSRLSRCPSTSPMQPGWSPACPVAAPGGDRWSLHAGCSTRKRGVEPLKSTPLSSPSPRK